MVKWIIRLIPVFIFLKWFFGDNNFWDCTQYVGVPGSGKTSIIAKHAQQYLKKGLNVYCDVEIPGTLLFNPLELNRFTPKPYSVVIIDECSKYWNNRSYKSFDLAFQEWFRYHRQYYVKVELFSQAFDIDAKIRAVVDHLCILTRIGKITLIRPVVKYQGISQDENGNGSLIDSYKYQGILSWQFIFLPRYYGMFKSFNPPPREEIHATMQDYNDLSMIYRSTKKWLFFVCRSSATKLWQKVKEKVSAVVKRKKKDGQEEK